MEEAHEDRYQHERVGELESLNTVSHSMELSRHETPYRP
jgi:hypothetical protein